MVTAITDFDDIYLEVVNDGVSIFVKKAYVDVRLNSGDPDIVDFRWHWYEIHDHQRLFLLDYTRFTPTTYASAALLLADIQAFLVTQYGGASTNASETAKGVVEEATQAEVNAYTDTGATGAKLFIIPSKLLSWIKQADLTLDGIWHFVSAKLRIFNTAKTFYVEFQSAPTSNKTQTFQDATGTIALTGDIPVISLAAWTVFASTITGFSGTPTQNISYWVVGKTMLVSVSITGTSNATTLTFTLPFASLNARANVCQRIDNGTKLTGLMNTVAVSTTVNCFATTSETGFTALGTKAINGMMIVELQ